MAFIDIRLSDCVAYGFQGGPEWSTQLVELENGREQRNADWLYPKHRYSAQYMNLRREDQSEILAAFHAARGRLHCFRFKDWNDYETEGRGVLLPNLDSENGAAQLFKTYTFGTETSYRMIQAPVDAQVFRNGVAFPGELDLNTGLFTPDGEWDEASYTWEGEFDVWVRFGSDYNAFAIGNLNAHTTDVELVEVLR